ncbi:hypothetical protein Hsar01_03472 [Haloferula sargassicola]|uniref:TonB-dependent receptor n=2 Tax=Haloferula sargassicola TaxID=490096 RepID=A0ABP9UV21_9BACT
MTIDGIPGRWSLAVRALLLGLLAVTIAHAAETALPDDEGVYDMDAIAALLPQMDGVEESRGWGMRVRFPTASAGLPWAVVAMAAEAPEPPGWTYLKWTTPPGPWRDAGSNRTSEALSLEEDLEGPWAPGEVPEGENPMPENDLTGNPLPIEQRVGTAILEGEVSDVTTLEPIAGAIVSVSGTGREDETDSQGKFRITHLPEGNVTVEALKLGYSSGTAAATLRNGTTADIRIALRVKPQDSEEGEYLLAEESIVGEYTESSQGDFNLDLNLSNTLSSGISKDDFTKTGVSDAAGAVGKVAGANIVGGKFAVVRGLADRYVTTLFNGAAISSADPSRKAVQLDIFPTTAIQSIDVNKTYWPQLPGDFGGGTIQINSLNIPTERVGEFKYKIGTNSNHGDRMLVHPNRDLGFWGDVDQSIPDGLLWNLDANGDPASFKAGGRRVVPGNTTNATLQQRQLEAALAQQALADQHAGNMQALDRSQSFMPAVEKPQESQSFSLVYGDRKKFDNGVELGVIAAFQHSLHDEVNAVGQENRVTEPARSWDEESYTRELDWSVYLGTGIRLGENHEISATYFKKHIVDDNITHGTNYRVEGDGVFGAFAKNDAVIDRYGASAIYTKEFWTIDPVIRDTELKQLRGTHKNDTGTKLSWSITDSLARESRPHSSTFQNGMLDFTDPAIAAAAAIDPNIIYNPALGRISTLQYSTYVNDGIGSLDSSRETQTTEEKALEASLDLTQSLYLTDEEEDGRRIDFSIGGSHLQKEREQSGRVYLLRTSSWEKWIERSLRSWWTEHPEIAPFSEGSPMDATTLFDGSPLPEGYANLGQYLADHPDALINYYNGYASEQTGAVPGTGSGSSRAFYVLPDAPFYLNGSGLEVRNVDSDLTLVGAHASVTYFDEWWRAGFGARWEQETKSYVVAADPLTRLPEDNPSRFGSITTNALMPAVMAGIDIVPDKYTVNLAWSRTVARPTFHEFLPIESIAQDTGIVRRGNADLTETGISNFDVSADLRFNDHWSGRVSAFHKDLTDPIVVVQRVDLGINSNTYVNGDSGSISGFEVEGSWSQGPFSLTGNYAFINSVLNYKVNQGLVVTPLETRFPFQPSQILNLTLGWAPEDSPWAVYLTGNFTDEYPTILRSDPEEYDVWVLPQLTLDLTVARKFEFDAFTGTVTFGVRNLTDVERHFEYRGGPPGGSAAYDGLTYTTESPGRETYIEFKGKF